RLRQQLPIGYGPAVSGRRSVQGGGLQGRHRRARGVALDSMGNLWVASVMSPDFPLPKIPAGVSIMEQFALILEALKKNIMEGKKTGVVSMIRPDGTQPVPGGFTGGGNMNAGWGIVVDGNDDVWGASGLGRGIVLLAGAGPNG